ncbi:8-amino-7-oxononanoate synthase [Thiomicrorhabdus sediminis]|uniref:8-amino-7-oxononanoate synthase n=1 Tax=Thiomicrorhabdus sediminis TaxID=2580412 RepID=A0A4P9K366_9GAMM|nr:8-amino-7-oxononanoate synthase [Thiomicrorhabdus sediminis]QCU89265.1 8-amino-7-oxononanoate synthase [Thiomicrorhabdus sediminis]
MSIESRFLPLLQNREEQHLYRRRPLATSPQQAAMQINGWEVINFSSNDYLGLANHPQIKQALITALQSDAISYGAGAAHLVTGHHLHHHLLEDELADWLGVERTLLFSTGYMANLAVQQALMQAGDTILADKLNHASLIDGAQLSQAEFKRYPHLDMKALERRLQNSLKNASQTLIVSDGVFSMDGDIAPLNELQQLARQYDAWLMIDDAHGIGCLGDQGRGCFEYFGCELDSNTILIGTLGKAFGCSGAFVAGSEILIETLIQFARPYVYTTAMPQLNALAIRESLKLIKTDQASRETLQRNIKQFKQSAIKIGLNLMPSDTAIQPILLHDSAKALQWSEQLKQQGFWVTAIRPPTVPTNQARLRITLSASHTEKQISALLNALQTLLNTSE